MNNATLALNVARPAAPATPSPAVRDQEDTSPSKRFDTALDAAHANGHDPRDPVPQGHDAQPAASGKDSAPATKTVDAQTGDRKPVDDPAKKDDADSDDTSVAATMLSLIGVPPKVTDLAPKVLDVAKGVAGETSAALAGLLPGAAGMPAALPGTAAGAQAALGNLAGLKDPASSMLGTAAPTTAAAIAVAAPSFGNLLAAQGVGMPAKDDASSLDPSNPSPMPLAHPQTLGPASIPVVQATQVATSPQFAQELGEQIAWMGSGDVKEARIKLHPEELGSMDVRVNLDGGKVNIAILAQHPAAVHAVQQTLSQLDSMLAHHGLSLGQADVGQRQAGQGGNGNGPGTSGSEAEAKGAPGTIASSPVSRGLLDEIA